MARASTWRFLTSAAADSRDHLDSKVSMMKYPERSRKIDSLPGLSTVLARDRSFSTVSAAISRLSN